MTKKERTERILEYFHAQQPEITTELEFGSVFQLLCAVVLSAQCTDKRVNMVTPALFKHFPTPQEMAKAEAEDILAYISSVSYPNAKSLHLVQLARKLVTEFDGEVPHDFDALVSLPGVGRKTANVMLAVAFDQAAMPVDTHVFRVSHRLGLATKKADTPEKVERELVKLIPAELLSRAHHWILLHGRYICTARKAHCNKCPISELCPSKNK
ncbi:endonuclease III [Prevotella sp. PINT]|jgi:endonuclease III|uniref:endonuclease III n=1 Tax=Palleniella intestinalis TaxID=2736291 RepID=UPI001557BBCA|nr:endonuclease III [Palleniella intestinalis]NPD80379.1 endonuclease III [Palleniella intestinalis]